MRAAKKATTHLVGYLFIAGFLALLTIGRILGGGFDDDWEIVIGISLLAVLGSYLVARRPGYRLGWVLAWTSVLAGVTGVVNNLLPDPQPTLTVMEGLIAVVLGNFTWSAFFWTGLGMFLLLFPTGAVPGPRWRWVARVGWLSVLVGLPLELLNQHWCYSWGEVPNEITTCVTNPIGASWIPDPGIAFMGVIVAILASAVSAVMRFRRSEDLERRQLKVFVFGVGTIVAGVAVGIVLEGLVGVRSLIFQHIWGLVLWTALPISMAVAILRHGLYEIDRVVSRTVSYTLVVIVLGGIYFGLVTMVTAILPAQDALAVAASTLVVAALFNPFRKRIHNTVDRRFNRSAYQAEIVSEQFATTLSKALTSEDIVAILTGTVEEFLHPSTIGVWLASPGTKPRP